MGIFKILIKIVFFFFFGYLLACKPSKEQHKEIIIANEKVIDTITTYPKYLTKNYVLGKFDYTKHPDFIVIPKELSSKKNYLRRDVFDVFHKMSNDAKKDGVSLKIISGTRNFAHQKRIWDYKYNNKFKHIKNTTARMQKILEYSSMPSTSRHHWGTDIDINSLNNNYFSYGKGKKEYEWLVKNANKFGFYQVYTSKENGRTGYNEEKWHWSFAPLSSKYLTFYNENINYKDISNFKGSEKANKLNIIPNFVNGINPELLNFKQ